MCVGTETRGQHQASSPSDLNFLESLSEPEAHGSAQTGWPASPARVFLPCLPSAEVAGALPRARLSCGWWGLNSGPHACREDTTNRVISPAPPTSKNISVTCYLVPTDMHVHIETHTDTHTMEQ